MKWTILLAIIIAFGILGCFFISCNKWDNVFPKNPNVITQKVHFHNRYGIELVGDLYMPKNKSEKKLPAIAISGPFILLSFLFRHPP